MGVGKQAELGQLVLKRFLLLVLLLDRAVTGPKGYPPKSPLLFRRGQPTKSSAEVGHLLGASLTTLTPHAVQRRHRNMRKFMT
jgi:hypothetical protein